MSDLPEQNVDLTLSQAEGLVLFELLARFARDHSLRLEDPAEAEVLDTLRAELQRQLVEPQMSNYPELLEVARSAVRPPTRRPESS